MSMLLNVTIILLLIGIVCIAIGWRIVQGNRQRNQDNRVDREKYTVQAVEDYVRQRLTELSTMNLYNLGLSEEDFKRQSRRRQELKDALKNCNTGDYGSKTYVRELIIDMIEKEYDLNEDTIDWVLPFDTPSKLSARDQFDIMLYLGRKTSGPAFLGQFLDRHGLSQPKEDGSYRITEDEIRAIYKKTVRHITFEDKICIIAQRVYSQFKGFGVIDDIRDMTIDGVSGGVSGLPSRMENLDDESEMISSFGSAKSGLTSVWVMYAGKSIHFSFLSFSHEAELRRIVQNVHKYNFPGQLSESRPYIINEMHDGSRVTVVRPKFSESWAFFIRKKYDMKKLSMENLLPQKNAVLPLKLMKFLMKGNRVTAVTGEQGSGKTTLLMALVGFIHRSLNLRIQETSFELNLRSLYPERNILSFQETDTMSGQDGLDLQKKTDGAVNILGEVATDPVAAWMIQTGQVASLFTLFTHHAKTFDNLVDSLRNSLLKVGMFSNEAIAEQQVVSVLEFDIHLRKDYDGSRYIERITECVPIDPEEVLLPNTDVSKEDKLDVLYTVATNYFRQQTQKRQYRARNLVEFVDGEYVAAEPISQARYQEIEALLSPTDREEFRAFVRQFWGDVA